MRGRHHSLESRVKISKSKKGQMPWMLGKHHTPESIKKISAGKKGQPSAWKGKHHSPESIQKIKEAKSHICDETRRRISESKKIESSAPEVRERLRNQRLKQTFPFKDAKTTEIPIQNELKRRGIPFTTHLLIMGKNNRMVRAVDIAFPEHKLVVECDGDYWHANPLTYKTFNNWQIKRIGMDKQQDERIREVGWQVIRFWESDIKKDAKACVDKIEKALRTR
jgi:very-short-patch-repair endonuclease